MIFRFLFAMGLVFLTSLANAQNSDGAAFANGFVPTAPGQVVNPAAVNSQAWSGQTILGTNNIAGTGAFTQPNTNSSQFSSGQYSGSLSNFGNKAMIDCANYVPTGNVAQDQYCAGVNYLTNNCIQPNSAQKSILSNAGVVRNAAGNCAGSYGTGIAQSYQISGNDANLANAFATSAKNNSGVSGGCQILTVNTPAQYKTYDCVQSSYSTANTCTYDLNPQYGYATSPFQVNNGPQVAPYSAGTFNYTVTLDGIPSKIILNQYKADNYGQLWVNGQLVISNVLGGMTDLRNGYVTSTPYTCDDNGCYGGDSIFVNADGSTTGFGDDGCNWGCRGVYPASDITSYFKPGANQITSACANAMGWGDCVINISMQAYGITGATWIDNCTALETSAGSIIGTPQ